MSHNDAGARGPVTPIVAIGASAGGLEACRALLAGLRADAPASFVLVLHLDPSHDSMMVDLLARDTGLKVVQAADGMALRPGHVHVIPPGAFLTIAGHKLRLTTPEGGKGVRMPFDVLLQALAREAGARAACIVLSGTGTDGSIGLAAIHAAGGFVIAQEPGEAGYAGMPESAIATGLVHRILTTDRMPAALAEHWAHGAWDRPHAGPAAPDTPADTPPGAAPEAAQEAATGGTARDYGPIVDFVGRHGPRDLSLYKSGTLERRIARRMALAGVAPTETDRYLELLRDDPAETAQLAADLLIHVTGFFRDPAVFRHLSEEAVPDLIADLPDDRPLRIWVAGCSTGEEAYSLAMVCLEAFAAADTPARLQVLASDADADAVATARAGFYPPAIEAHVAPERLARFFVRENGGWRVRAALRDVVVFTVADLLSDPPFSRIDLVSCRNVMIYLGPEAQRRVIAACCFALRPGGLLLLGAAETPGIPDGRFAVADKAARLWRRVGRGRAGDLHFAPALRSGTQPAPPTPPVGGAALADLCRRVVLDRYAPAVVLMNRRLECLYLLGPTERYLRIGQGHADPGFLAMLPKVMRARVRDAAAECDLSTPLVRVPGARIPGTPPFRIDLRAVPAGDEVLLMACFVEEAEAPARPPPTTRPDGADGAEDAEGALEADLARTRSELGHALRDLEREVEAHGADVAEALSVNEEFQSTNEELLASKEELQSLNEELTALNSQLQETLERHRTTANDLQNVLYSTDVATLFLDRDLNIRFFTPAARALFRVIPTDIGRPLADLAATAADEALVADAHAVLASPHRAEREIAGPGELWYLRRIQPYRGEGGRIDGVVITFTDITERKRTTAALEAAMQAAETATRAKSRFLAAASHDLRQPLQSLALLHGLMTRSRGKAEADRLAALLDRTLRAMTEMLDSLLDLNRIESGVVRPAPVPVALGPLMARVTEEFAPLCAQKGLKLRSVTCKAWVRTDPRLLEQMLRNLLSNALKYTDRGGIVVGARHRAGQRVLEVRDSGIGVAASEQEAIFEPYHQIDIAGAQGGQGLGLSIVRRLGQLLDHPVTVRSAPGKGAVFMIALPVVVAGAAGVAGAPPAPRTAQTTGTVLVVEDDDQLRELLAQILEAAGHSVVARRNARDALAWAAGAAAGPDLLLADLELNDGQGGLALARDLPGVLGFAVPTLILTGDISAATIRAIGATPHAHLVKPVLPEVLLARISDLLAAAPGRAARGADGAALTVHLVDDDPLLREAARRLFEVEGWAVVTYPSAEAFLAAPRPHGAACLVVDARLPGVDGVHLLEVLHQEPEMPPAIILTAHGDAAMAVNAMKAGAADLIEKPASATDLLASVRQAVARSGDARAQASARQGAEARLAGLTAREREVLSRVLEGAPNKIIAADLGINQRTVENHRAAVMRKTGAVSLPALVRLALAAGIETA